jgi:hypothetical protein
MEEVEGAGAIREINWVFSASLIKSFHPTVTSRPIGKKTLRGKRVLLGCWMFSKFFRTQYNIDTHVHSAL